MTTTKSTPSYRAGFHPVGGGGGLGGGGVGEQGGSFPPPPQEFDFNLIKHHNIKVNHQIKPLAFIFDQNYPRQSKGIKEIFMNMRPKELGMLNTPTHLSYFHPKFLSLDETLQ